MKEVKVTGEIPPEECSEFLTTLIVIEHLFDNRSSCSNNDGLDNRSDE